YLDYDRKSGTIPEVVLTLTKQDDRLTFDYSKSSPQVPAATNCTFGGLIAGAVWDAEMTATAALSKLAACSDTYLREAQASPAGRPGGGGSTFGGVTQ